MDSVFLSSVSGTPPAAPAVPLVGFPRAGNAMTGEKATRPGPYWYHMITQELRNLVVAAGLTPDAGSLNQVLLALQAMFAANGRPGHAYTDNDWAPLGGGLILQWGKGTYANAATITLPTAYPNSHIGTFAAIDGQFAGANIELSAVSDMTLTSFKIYGVTNPQTGGAWTAVSAPQWWVSIGR